MYATPASPDNQHFLVFGWFSSKNHNIPVFVEKGHAKKKRKGPCQARGGHRRPSLFSRKINKSVF